MGKLSDDMQRVVREQRLGYVATVSPDGTPNLSPKGTLTVWDDDHLVFADIRSPATLRNLRINPAVEINVGFIARDMLERWRDVSMEIISAAPAWERFGRVASRHLAGAGLHDEAQIARFMQEVPALLRRTWEHVGEERVREYLHESKARARSAIREYLS